MQEGGRLAASLTGPALAPIYRVSSRAQLTRAGPAAAVRGEDSQRDDVHDGRIRRHLGVGGVGEQQEGGCAGQHGGAAAAARE